MRSNPHTGMIFDTRRCLMNGFATMLLRAAVLAALLPVLPGTPGAWAQRTWSLTRAATSFDRSELTRPEYAQIIRSGGSLSGGKQDRGITGWVEYDFDIPRSGWYEITVKGGGREVLYLIDAQRSPKGAGVASYSTSGHSLTADKVGNFWLAAGGHSLRLQRYFWTGFPRIEAISITAASDALAKSIRVSLTGSTRIFRLRECAPLEVFSGGRSLPTMLTLWIKDPAGRQRRVQSLPIPQSADLSRQTVALPCEEPGTFTVSFGENGNALPYPDVRWIEYEVIDTSAPAPDTGAGHARVNRTGSSPIKTLVEEIDCARTPPDYFSGGATRVVSTASGLMYRESGDTGFTRYQRAPSDAIRKLLPEPDWFAYRLRNIVAQNHYLVDVDYPDDQFRTFAIALRESAPLSYPVAGGVDSGGEFSLSGGMLTHSLLYWPRADGTRVTLLNAHDGRRAAASKIRVYRLEETPPPLLPRGLAGRQFINWYEEGSNFRSMYGAADQDTNATVAATRWAEAVRYSGGTILAPTVAVYSFALYPSNYHLAFSQPDQDMLRRLLLVAERHGLKVLPELHPRADELSWYPKATTGPMPHLLVSREGKTSRGLPPLHNPLYPPNQQWYLDMIGELADRYRDSPALLGVNLRLMQWANPALNNLHSLDWGYDDYTVGLFIRETGLAVPTGAPGDASRFTARHRWLMANARAQWIDWRCRKIAALYTRIRDRVRAARPDLKVYTSVFPWKPGDAPLEELREAGIDTAMLGEIDGVELINALHSYGRNEADVLDTQVLRDAMLESGQPASLPGSGAPGRFLTGAAYLEITEAVAHPRSLGFPENTKLTWTSAVANPAGRHSIERFAVQLAQTDAMLLGDGGNGYSLGQPVLREFLAEYLRLPVERFSPRPDARDPVAVWERRYPEGLMFYAVNRERFPVMITVNLSPASKLFRLSDDSPLTLKENQLQLVLEPYQLMAFRADPGTRISSVATTVAPEHRHRVARQVRWIAELAREQNEKWLPGLDQTQRALLNTSAIQAAAALASGHLWRARTVLEKRGLLSIYRHLGKFPPDLRDPRTSSLH